MTAEEIARRLRAIEREQQRLDGRLFAVENSLYFRWARAVGRWLSRVEQRLLSSPLRSLYLRMVPPPPDPYDRYVRTQDNTAPASGPADATIGILLRLDPAHGEDCWARTLASIKSQTYGKWELLVIGGPFQAAENSDARIHWLTANATTLDEAAKLSGTTHLCVIDSNAILEAEALAWVAAALPADLVYTDEDRIDASGRFVDPIFKPEWSPDLQALAAYTGRLTVYGRQVWWQAGGYGMGGEADFARRAATVAKTVKRVPKVLYHGQDRHALTRGISGEAWTPAPESFVSIIICSRSPRLLESCLSSLAAATAFSRREVLVVQHLGGQDAELSAVIARHGAKAIPYAGPFHFSRMNNLAAARASGDLLLFLNDDVRPLDPSWLGRLAGQLARADVGAAGARLLYPTGHLQHAGVAIGIGDGCGHIGRNTTESLYWPWLTTTREVSAVTGACLGIRKNVFHQVGGFSQRYPVNYNDVDLCLRIRALGLRVIFDSGAVLEHDECQTRQAGVSYNERRDWWMDWGDLLEAGDPYYSPHLTDRDESLTLRPPG